jgi:hypothetical protein
MWNEQIDSNQGLFVASIVVDKWRAAAIGALVVN